MDLIKIPIIFSVISFLLLFIVNLAKGNSFGLTLLRSLLYGAVVFGIFFGIVFLITKVFNIEIEGSREPDEDDEAGGGIDVTVGDEDLSSGINEGFGEFDSVSSDDSADEDSVDSGENSGGSGDFDLTEDLTNIAGAGLGDISGQDTDSLGRGDLSDYEGTEDLEGAIDIGGDVPMNAELGESSNESESIADSIKEKLGVDVTFEEVAKAIRTKLKHDD